MSKIVLDPSGVIYLEIILIFPPEYLIFLQPSLLTDSHLEKIIGKCSTRLENKSRQQIQEEIFRSVERQTPVVFCQFSWKEASGPQFLYAEGKLKSALGFDAAEGQMAFWECLHVKDRALLIENIRNSQRNLSPVIWEGRFVSSQIKKWLRVYLEPGKAGDEMVWSGVVTDISGLKRNEDIYQEMQGLLQETEKMAKIGSWKVDVETKVPVWSKEVYKIYEMQHDTVVALEMALDCYPGEARAAVEKAIAIALEEGIGYDLELPFVSAKGTKKWVRTIGKPRFENGQISVLYGVIQDITIQKETVERNQMMDSLLSEAEALSHSGSWEANLVTGQSLWSAEAFRIFGFKPEKGKGLSAEQYEALIHPDDFEKYRDVLAQAIKDGKSCNSDFRLLMPSGEIKHVQSIGKAIRDEKGRTVKLFGAIQDITHRKTIEEALLLKQVQLNTFITSSPVAISMLDKNLNYMAASDVWIREYMKEGVEIIGKNHLELFPGLDDKWVSFFNRCLKGEVLNSEEDSYIKSDGSVEWVKWEIRPWFEKKHVVGGIIVYTEAITQRKLAREELIKTKEKAEEAALVKSQFLATMSHEIRTPMNAVIGLTKLLIESNPRADQIKNLNTLHFSAKSLLQIINDILDLNKIEAGKIVFECIQFNLYELLRNIRDTFEPQAKDKDIKLSLDIERNVPEFVWGDSVRLGQVVTNLLNNALKFTLKGAVSIRLSLRKETVEASSVHFSIVDTGIGIPNDKLAYIFENFTQASSETTRRFGGTGLGLSITQKLLEMQRAELKVKSQLNKGSEFSFDLNFPKGPNNSTEIPMVAAARTKPSLKGLKILLAEDNKINVVVARQFLRKWNVELDVAEDGNSALKMAIKKDYNLILMDLLMPGMDGYMATKAIKSLEGEKYRDLPIIALTASAMSEIKEKALEAGMVDYISKPFDPEILYEKIVFHAKSKARKEAFPNT